MHALPLSARLSPDDFLSIDGPTGNALAPGDPREKFFEYLGMDERNRRHQMIYASMKSEAKAGMRRLFASRMSLDPVIRHDSSIFPPYSLEQISEVAFQQQVADIYVTASTETRGIYDWVQTDQSNWLIRWMIYRVIKAKHDQHVSSLAPAMPTAPSPTVTETSCATTTQTACTSLFSAARRTSSVGTSGTSDGYGECDRNHHGHHCTTANVPLLHNRPPDLSVPSRKTYWDHVMGT